MEQDGDGPAACLQIAGKGFRSGYLESRDYGLRLQCIKLTSGCRGQVECYDVNLMHCNRNPDHDLEDVAGGLIPAVIPAAPVATSSQPVLPAVQRSLIGLL